MNAKPYVVFLNMEKAYDKADNNVLWKTPSRGTGIYCIYIVDGKLLGVCSAILYEQL